MIKKCICVLLIVCMAASTSVSCNLDRIASKELQGTESVLLDFLYVGASIQDLKASLGSIGGMEIDLKQYSLSWDNWLYAFEAVDYLCLAHTDYSQSGELVIDAYALYETEGNLAEWVGNKPLLRSFVESYKTQQSSPFQIYCGYWGMNYSEDEYIYFLDTPGVVIYNKVEHNEDALRVVTVECSN